MWEKTDEYVKRYHMLEEGDCVMVGLSGGADSVCLLRYLLARREPFSLRICAIHVNHMLRGEEADRDEAFARNLCGQWGIPFMSVKRDVAAAQKKMGCSMEEAGRLVRRACFEEAAEKWGCRKIALAHHRGDLAETLLFRMARGTGIYGLAGIRPVSGRIIRPLLCLTRQEILACLEACGQGHVEDSTNRETVYSRNRIRLEVLPQLEKINARAVDHIGQLAEQAAEWSEYLETIFHTVYEQNVVEKEEGLFLPLWAFEALQPLERKETVRRMLIRQAGRLRDLSAVHVEQVMQLAGRREGKYIELPYGMEARRLPDGILVAFRGRENAAGGGAPDGCPVPVEELERTGRWQWTAPDGTAVRFCLRSYDGSEIEKNDCVKYFDYDRIKSTLCLRTRRSGDYFVVDREGRHKSLRRYFIDEQIPARERGERILLAGGAHVLWVIGGRISEAFRVQPDTKRVLVVSVTAGSGQVVPTDGRDRDRGSADGKDADEQEVKQRRRTERENV